MKIWTSLLDILKDNKRATLLIILQTKGSSPGRPGFKMIVSEDKLVGSIGGGEAEFSAVEKAKEVIHEERNEPFIFNQVHEEGSDNSSGMICAGQQTIAFVPLNEAHVSIIKSMIDDYNNGIKGLLKVTSLGLFYLQNKTIAKSLSASVISDTDWLYQEQIGIIHNLYIFGGGHVSLQLSKVMSEMDFRITVFDNRDSLPTMDQNHYANKKLVIDYNNVEKLQLESNSFMVIMTYGHHHDYLILKQLIKKESRYLGLMGSASKIGTVKKSLMEEGFSSEEFDRVDMPIGVPIKSRTPYEIAISIAAKIIHVKNTAV